MNMMEAKEDGVLRFSCNCDSEVVNVTHNQCNQLRTELIDLTKSSCKKDVHEINQTELVFQVVLVLIVGFLGVCGNVGAIHRFSRLRKPTKFHHLMMLISIYDILCISTIVLIFSAPQMSEDYKNSTFYHYFAPVALPLTQVALTGSIYTTLAITLERYLIVCHPFYVVSHEWSSKLYVLPIVIFSIVYNVPKFFELYAMPCMVKEIKNGAVEGLRDESTKEVIKVSNFTSSCFQEAQFKTTNEGVQLVQYFILPTMLRLNTNYYSIYGIWMNLIFMGTLPVITLIILNTMILKSLISNLKDKNKSSFTESRDKMKSIDVDNPANVNHNKNEKVLSTKRKKMKPKEIKLAKVGLYIVLIFVLCHSVRWIPNFYELSHPGDNAPPWVDAFMHISHFVIVFNSSVNFYIYCLTHLNVVEKIRRCYVVEKMRRCYGEKANYVGTRFRSVSQSLSARQITAKISSQTRKTSIDSSTAEEAYKTRLQSIMKDMQESVTIPMLSTHAGESDDDYDDEW